ncbi:hypothetical protein SUDANB58_02302 [Streptomyces sp. enrichment culture]|uniref:hypothetical protein n=1 Tax=Streptomyces sp. enrichment culture TaxID=1795815 RepID=UPI003F54ECD4
MSIEFLITAFIIVVSPGTGAVYTVGTGLARGFRVSVVAAFAPLTRDIAPCEALGHPPHAGILCVACS